MVPPQLVVEAAPRDRERTPTPWLSIRGCGPPPARQRTRRAACFQAGIGPASPAPSETWLVSRLQLGCLRRGQHGYVRARSEGSSVCSGRAINSNLRAELPILSWQRRCLNFVRVKPDPDRIEKARVFTPKTRDKHQAATRTRPSSHPSSATRRAGRDAHASTFRCPRGILWPWTSTKRRREQSI